MLTKTLYKVSALAAAIIAVQVDVSQCAYA